MTDVTLPAPWTPSPGSRVPPPLPQECPGRLTPWGPLAGWWQRGAAVLLDGLLAVPGLLVQAAGRALAGHGEIAIGAALALLGVVAAWAPVLWTRVAVAGRTGQSFGRRVVGIRLVSGTGEPLTGPVCLARELVHAVDGIFGIGYLVAAGEPKGRTLADAACGSVVVRA